MYLGDAVRNCDVVVDIMLDNYYKTVAMCSHGSLCLQEFTNK